MPQTFRSLRAEAIVLRHSDYGEADRIVTLFTRERGKLRAIVKGARKIASRKAGHLEPFTRLKIQLATGRDLYIVTQAETIDAYPLLREDLTRMSYAAYVIELLDRFVQDEEAASPSLFKLLAETLARLASESDAWLAIRYYEMRLLDFLGFRPQLFTCANCGREILAEHQFFSPSLGGAVCPTCGRGLPGLWPVATETLKYLRHFQRSTYGEAARAQPEAETKKEVEALMQAYFTYLLERELNTPGFLRKINS